MTICDAIGIDLGTKFCRAAVFRDGKVEIVKNKNNEEATPSIVAFRKDGYSTGSDALNKVFSNEKNGITSRDVIFNIKRFIGKRNDDERVSRDGKYYPFHLTEAESGLNVEVACQNKSYYPEEITGILLSEMKDNAEKLLNNPVKKAIITVPASFNNLQRLATLNAGKIAGFETVQLINKPTAIAIDYYFESRMKGKKVFCVVQLGGGSFDVSVIKIDNGSSVEVIATTGNSHLGGVDFDQKLIECFVDKCGVKQNKSKQKSLRESLQVRNACEHAKIDFSSQKSVTIQAEGYSRTITLEDYEKKCKDLYAEIKFHVETLFKKREAKEMKIDKVLLAGESMQIPKLQNLLIKLLEKNSSFHFDLKQLAVCGAAIQATTSFNRGIFEIIPHTVKSEGLGRDFKFESNTRVSNKSQTYIRMESVLNKRVICRIYEEEEKWKKSRTSIKRPPTKTLIGEIEFTKQPWHTPKALLNLVFYYDENSIIQHKAHMLPGSRVIQSIVNVCYLTEEKVFDLCELAAGRKMEHDRARTQKNSIETGSEQPSTSTQNQNSNKNGEKCTTKHRHSTRQSLKSSEKRKHVESDQEPTETSKKFSKLEASGTFQNIRKLQSKLAIGIDIGTTSSRVAVFHEGRINVLDNEKAKRTTPSTVKFTKEEVFVGEQGGLKVANSILNVKRFIGKKFDDQVVQSDIAYCSYNVKEENRQPVFEVEFIQRMLTPEEISSFIIRKMKNIAANVVGDKVKDAVIIVPSCFNERQRQATIDAATIAGINTVQLISSSTAAAAAYYIENPTIEKRNMFVLSFGGGSIEASIFTIDGFDITVKSTAGNCELGGVDFDKRLIQHCIKEFEEKNPGNDLSGNKRSLHKLREACMEVKRKLSFLPEADVNISNLFDDEDFKTIITRDKFEELCRDLFDEVKKIVERAFSRTKISKSEVDDVLLIGGSTRIPKVQAIIRDFFGGEGKIRHSVNLDEACVYGAAVVAAHHSGVDNKNIMALQLYEPNSMNFAETSDGKMSEKDIETIMAEIEKMDLKTETYKKLSRAKNDLEDFILSIQRKLRKCEILENAKNVQTKCQHALDWMGSNNNYETKEVVQKLSDLKNICEPVIIDLKL